MKLKIGIAGISGRIGRRLVEKIKEDDLTQVSSGLVSQGSSYSIEGVLVNSECIQADVWIDFSTPEAFEKVLLHCVKYKTPFVSGTTGLSKKHYIELKNASVHIPVIWTSNFSISINLIHHLLSNYNSFEQSQAKITETHHTHKIDKPSGTAITLAKAIKPDGVLKPIDEDNFLFDDIAITSVREGEVPGIHCIELTNQNEDITITHSAKKATIFAQGSLNVAKWLVNKETGFYTMTDYIDSMS